MRALLAAAFSALFLTSALAQAQAPQQPASISVLSGMVGQLAGQNAQLVEQIQHLQAELAEARKQLDAAKGVSTTKTPEKK